MYMNLFNKFSVSDLCSKIPCVDATIENTVGLCSFLTDEQFENYSINFKEIRDHNNTEIITPRVEVVDKIEIVQKGKICTIRKTDEKEEYPILKVDPLRTYTFYFRELRYNIDSNHMLFPGEASPFIVVLGTNVNDLKAFIFDGKCGIDILPGVLYQYPFLHYQGSLLFYSKKSTCNMFGRYDSMKETKSWLTFDYV